MTDDRFRPSQNHFYTVGHARLSLARHVAVINHRRTAESRCRSTNSNAQLQAASKQKDSPPAHLKSLNSTLAVHDSKHMVYTFRGLKSLVCVEWGLLFFLSVSKTLQTVRTILQRQPTNDFLSTPSRAPPHTRLRYPRNS